MRFTLSEDTDKRWTSPVSHYRATENLERLFDVKPEFCLRYVFLLSSFCDIRFTAFWWIMIFQIFFIFLVHFCIFHFCDFGITSVSLFGSLLATKCLSLCFALVLVVSWLCCSVLNLYMSFVFFFFLVFFTWECDV